MHHEYECFEVSTTLKVLLIQERSSKASLMVYLRRTTQSTMLRCFKITEKVSFNIASEASYSYILSGQKLIKTAKNSQFGEFLKN